MDIRVKRVLSNSVVRKLILFGMTKCKGKTRRAKHKASRHAPLIRRALIHSAQILATPSVSSLQKLSAQTQERIVVNVGGFRYEIPKKHLGKFPNTLLGSERKKYFYDEEKVEYFFDRDHVIFRNIVEFYRTGCFHVSPTDCKEAILDELEFFGIPKQYISECCWEYINFEDEDKEGEGQTSGAIQDDHTSDWKPSTGREKLWDFLTNSNSSVSSAVFGYLFCGVVLLNISAMIAETVPSPSGPKYAETNSLEFFGMDSFCVGIFTVEYLARLYSAPIRIEFIKDPSNVIDLLGIIPYYIGTVERIVKSNNKVLDFFVTVFRMFRVFRITKLARHSERFQNLLRSVQSAATELGGILFSFLAIMVTFSSILYYFESHEKGTDFVSIPAACWYTLVTMTTLGYGDMVPGTVKGKLLGAACALMGVLLLSLPVPIIEKKLIEFTTKSTPKRNDITTKLAASIGSLAQNSCSQHNSGTTAKTMVVKRNSRTVSMVVARGSVYSIDSSSNSNRSISSSSSINSSADNLITIKTKLGESMAEEDGPCDLNGNRNIAPSAKRFKNRSWHGSGGSWHDNGDVPSGVGNGIFTESPPVSQHFPVCRHFLSSNEDAAGHDGKCEVISMRNLGTQMSYDGINFGDSTTRRCHSVGL